MLDEKALRRDGFTEGIRVVLGDGQEWSLPGFTYRFVPDYDENGRIVPVARVSRGRDVDADLDVWFGASDAEPIEQIGSMMRIAAGLLQQNYDLDIAALQALLPWDDADPDSLEMWGGVVRAVLGTTPKAQAGGSGRP